MVRVTGLVAASKGLAAASAAVKSACQVQMHDAMARLHGDLVNRTLLAPRRPSSGLIRPGGEGGLALDSGKLRSTVQSRVFISGDVITGAVGSNVPWLPIHEYGGEIKGKPWLRIPTIYASDFKFIGWPRKASPAGRRGFALKSIPRTKSRATEKPWRTFFKSRGPGTVWLMAAPAGSRLRNQPAKPLYLLTTKPVHIPARKPFEQTVTKIGPLLFKDFDRAVHLALTHAG